MKPCKGEASCRTCVHYKYCSYDMKHTPKTAKRIKLKPRPINWKPISIKDLNQAQEFDRYVDALVNSYMDALTNLLHRKGI